MRRASAFFTGLLALSATVLGTGVASAGPPAPGEVSAQAIWQCDVGSGWCVSTTARVNLRVGPTLNDKVVITMIKGARFAPECWTYGTSVNGDNIWYWGTHRESADVMPPQWERGYVAGYYLATGKDPNPAFRQCGS